VPDNAAWTTYPLRGYGEDDWIRYDTGSVVRGKELTGSCERILSDGRVLLLELAPVDPRSLMQGDYMALQFAAVDDIRKALKPISTAPLTSNAATGGRVEIMIERLLGDGRALAQLGVSKPPQIGSSIALDAGGEAEVLERVGDGFWTLRFDVGEPLHDWLQHAGQLPLPPYIQRQPGADDAER